MDLHDTFHLMLSKEVDDVKPVFVEEEQIHPWRRPSIFCTPGRLEEACPEAGVIDLPEREKHYFVTTTAFDMMPESLQLLFPSST